MLPVLRSTTLFFFVFILFPNSLYGVFGNQQNPLLSKHIRGTKNGAAQLIAEVKARLGVEQKEWLASSSRKLGDLLRPLVIVAIGFHQPPGSELHFL
jgi:hypothetical protein